MRVRWLSSKVLSIVTPLLVGEGSSASSWSVHCHRTEGCWSWIQLVQVDHTERSPNLDFTTRHSERAAFLLTDSPFTRPSCTYSRGRPISFAKGGFENGLLPLCAVVPRVVTATQTVAAVAGIMKRRMGVD